MAELDDPARLEALQRAGLLDSPREQAFDRFTKLVRRFLNVPVALFSLVDDQRQFFKSAEGLPAKVDADRETPLSHSFCQYVVIHEAPLILEDARDHPVLCSNLAIRDLNVIAYLGVPVVGPLGHILGSLCAIDTKPKRWSNDDIDTLQELAQMLNTELELSDKRYRLQGLISNMAAFVGLLTLDGTLIKINKTALDVAHLSQSDVLGKPLWETYWFRDNESEQQRLKEAIFQARHGQTIQYDIRARVGEQAFIWVDFRLSPVYDAKGKIIYLTPSGIDITARKETEAKLLNSQTQYKLLNEAIPAIVFSSNSEGYTLHVNESWTELTGLSLDESKGEGWIKALHPEDVAKTMSSWNMALESKKPFNAEYRFRSKDGNYRWFLGRSVPLLNDRGEVQLWLGAALDIDERKRIEAALHESEARQRAFQQTTPDGFMMFESIRDKQGTITDFRWLYTNPAAEKIVGKSHQDLIGKQLLIEMPGNKEEGLFDAYVGVVETGQPWQREFTYNHEGLDHGFRSTAAKVGDGFAVSFSDITERIRYEEQLEQSQNRYRSLIEATSSIVWVRNEKGEFSERHLDWETYTGQSFATYQGHGWMEAIHPDDFERTKQAWSHALQTRSLYQIEYRMRRADGVYRWFSVYATPIFDEHKNIKEWIGNHIDITDRKLAELDKERLLETSQRSEREALALAEIASSFSLANPAETNFSKMAERLCLTINTLACILELYDYEKQSFQIVGSYGIDTYGLEQNKNNESTDEIRVVQGYLAPFLATDAPTYGPAVIVPIRGVSRGRMTIIYAPDYEPTISDFLQLSTISSQIALVIDNLRLFSEGQGKAALEERQKLARDLHDSVSQALYGISLGANSTKQALNRDASERKLSEVNKTLDYLIHMADTAMAEMKSLIFELRPESLEQEGLIVAIRKHLKALQLRYRFELDLNLCNEPDISIQAKEMLYRIMQESMNNIVKHAQATKVTMSLSKQQTIQLIVTDNGKGFDTTQAFPGHLGLKTMRERTESLGGSYSISSQPNVGTKVIVELPLEV